MKMSVATIESFAPADAANSVAAGATAAEASAKSDEQTRQDHDGKRAHRSKKCSALPERKTERGAANQTKQEHNPPFFVSGCRDKKASEHTGDTWNFSA